MLERVAHLLRARRGRRWCFRKGGRSRSGRVELEAAAYGVGRIVKALPGCRVLCVYLRGDGQEQLLRPAARAASASAVAVACSSRSRDAGGLRGSLEIARQIVARLAELERSHFDAR